MLGIDMHHDKKRIRSTRVGVQIGVTIFKKCSGKAMLLWTGDRQ